MQQAIAAYGFVGLFAASNPEVRAILERAAAEEWDSAKFERALWDTNWWKSNDEQRRSLEILRTTDPATYGSTLANKANVISNLAQQMGKEGVDANALAFAALTNNWNDDQLKNVIADSGVFRTVDGALTGTAGQYESHIRQTWAQFGLKVSDDWIKRYAQEISAGRQTLDGLDNEARNWAKRAFPSFTEQIDAGHTMQELASPYIQAMAQTLELSDGNLGLDDPYIKKALQGTDGQPLSLWQFERMLKDDPRWANTKQARNDAYSLVQQIGKDWGFLA